MIEGKPRGCTILGSRGRGGFNDDALVASDPAKGQGKKGFETAIGFRNREIIDELMTLLAERRGQKPMT